MPEIVAYLGLGSNEGDRLQNLRRAVELLEAEAHITVAARSGIYESQSVEGGGEGSFLNAAIRITTGLTAHELLVVCQRVEGALGRPAPPRSGARPVDVDILLFGDERHSTAELMVPHPRALSRSFVLRPLLDVLEGGWVKVSEWSW